MSSDETFSIVILKSKIESMRQAEVYLRNRKWTVWNTLNMREILMIIIQKQPQYVMISSDHPNKKVLMLPKLLGSAFPVKIIVFNEHQTPFSMKALQDMKVANSLFYPVSGPMIERMVLKIKKEAELAALMTEEQKAQMNSAADSKPDSGLSSGMIMFRGENSDTKEMQQSIEQARAALRDMLQTDDGLNGASFENSASGAANQDSAYAGANTSGSSPSDVGEGSSAGAGFGRVGPGVPLGNEHNAKESGKPNPAGKFAKTGAIPSGAGAAGANDLFSPQGSDATGGGFADYEAKLRNAAKFGAGTDESNDPTSAVNKDQQFTEPGSDVPYHRKEKSVPIFESGPARKKVMPTYKRDPGLQRQTDSIMIRGTQAAMDESAVAIDGLETYAKLEVGVRCSCIIIESEKFSGYLVAAMTKKKGLDEDFVKMVRQRLFTFLKSHGERIEEGSEAMNLKLQEVEFEDWALEHADFLRKSIHQGGEVAMAFFPHKDTTIPLDESASDKMLQIHLNEIKEDTNVEFDLFIYMPENNKYLLYTPEGRPLYGQQRTRLLEKGIQHLHLRKEAAPNVKKYRAQNFLNEKIQTFKNQKK